jgi:hypothetical protein
VFALQAATVGSNGGAHTAKDNDFWLRHLLSPFPIIAAVGEAVDTQRRCSDGLVLMLLIGFSFSYFHLTFSSLHC